MSTTTSNPNLPQPTVTPFEGGAVISGLNNSLTVDEIVLLLARNRALSARTQTPSRVTIARDVQQTLTRTPVGRM